MLFLDNPQGVTPAPGLLEESRRRFLDLPLYHRGESKELRLTRKPGLLIQRFLPTVYSFTANRGGVVPGTDRVRMDVSRLSGGVCMRRASQRAWWKPTTNSP
jgi:hypothetical protein